ncbi:f-boxkelch-repeat protein [Nicotiana attenuata]|uniref:F-boxkelch-repeat protein n=1 Tax=Nicotiana attenuata TaxID=49451 RepID=A0A1J6I8H6_NICAT|nr:f-boxkelch-repeat protein [Nicotiana attenuata]
MEGANYDELWSDGVPTDILTSISSCLIAGDYFAFCAVCKRWRYASLLPPLPPPIYDSLWPYLMRLNAKTGIVEFFQPVYNAITHKMDIPKLRGSRIRSSKANWLLVMSHDNRGMFFFNTKSNEIIELPDLLEETDNAFSAWTFSCPPDSSSDCFVVGFDMFSNHVCIIKVGESIWTYHRYINNPRSFMLFGCTNPVFFKNNTIWVLGDNGNLGILSIKENSALETPTWEFHGKSLPCRKRRSLSQIYIAEDVDNGGILAVFLTHEEGKVEVWRYNMNGGVLEREQITSLNNKTLFVSFGACYLKPCITRGLGNKIYFPMLHDNNRGVFYCLASRKYYSFDYAANGAFSSSNYYKFMGQPKSSIWIELTPFPPHD